MYYLFVKSIFCKNVFKENTFFKIGEQFILLLPIHCKDRLIDWNCVIIVKHFWKNLFSKGGALWAKLDTGQKKDVCMFAVTQPSLLESTNPQLFFVTICKKFWMTYLSSCKKSLYKMFFSALRNALWIY